MLNNKKQSFYILGIAFLGTIIAFIWFYLSTDFSDNRFGLIYTADEPSYFRPAQNWLENGVWKDNFIGNSAYFQRPPGYGFFFLIHSLLYGKYVYLGLLISQFACFYGSILLVAKTLSILKIENKYLFWSALSLYSFLPSFNGFAGYGLTESITPFLLISSFYTSLRFEDTKKHQWLFILSNAFLILVRPQLALFTIGFLGYKIVSKHYKSFLIGLIAFLPIIFWFGRILILAPEDLSLHPIYSYTNQTDYRPAHKAFTNLARTWEWQSDQFHETVAEIKKGRINDALTKVPVTLQQTVEPIFKEYYQLNTMRGEYNTNEFFSSELQFEKHCKLVKAQLIKENRATYYFKIPVKSAIEMLSKSQMNLDVFQARWRGNFLVEVMRWGSVLLINGSLFLVVLLVFRRKMDLLRIYAVCIIGTLFYYFFIQRLNEARYLVPLLPLLLLLGSYSLRNLVQKK